MLRARGVQRVFLVPCERPQDPCCAVAKHIWPIEDAPDFPHWECAWAAAPADATWEGCEFFPYFGALLAQTAG